MNKDYYHWNAQKFLFLKYIINNENILLRGISLDSKVMPIYLYSTIQPFSPVTPLCNKIDRIESMLQWSAFSWERVSCRGRRQVASVRLSMALCDWWPGMWSYQVRISDNRCQHSSTVVDCCNMLVIFICRSFDVLLYLQSPRGLAVES